MFGAHLEIMAVVEHKLCLVVVPLELLEKVVPQVQMQLMEEMGGREALEAGEDGEAMEDTVSRLPLLVQQEREVSAELVDMEAAEEEAEEEAAFIVVATIKQEQEMQEVLAVLEEEAEKVEKAEVLQTLA